MKFTKTKIDINKQSPNEKRLWSSKTGETYTGVIDNTDCLGVAYQQYCKRRDYTFLKLIKK